MQYRRAIQLYYRKFHAYPPNIDALVNTNNIRFLRKKYIDPMTGKDDWKPILFGQNKTPTAMGFFGQPLAGNASTIAGIGPSGGTARTAACPAGSVDPGGGSSLGSPGRPSAAVPSAAAPALATPDLATQELAASVSLSRHVRWRHRTTGTPASGTGTTGSSGTGSDSSGQTFGGAGIIGFSPASPRQSILVYKKKNHYNEWEFTYDPLSDMRTQAVATLAPSASPPAAPQPHRNHYHSGFRGPSLKHPQPQPEPQPGSDAP